MLYRIVDIFSLTFILYIRKHYRGVVVHLIAARNRRIYSIRLVAHIVSRSNTSVHNRYKIGSIDPYRFGIYGYIKLVTVYYVLYSICKNLSLTIIF